MRKIQRLSRNTSLLLVCDIQEKYVSKMYGKEGLLEASQMMIRSANVLGVPIIATQQTRKVMGETCESLKKHFPEGQKAFQKTKFSMLIPEVQQVLVNHPTRNQIILIGMETQVCILQTCLDLLQKNYEVFLPIDALTSSRAWERSVALNRMQKNGAILTTYESAVFDLLKDAKDEKFKDVLTIIKGSQRGNAISHL